MPMTAVFIHRNGSYETRPINALVSVFRFPVPVRFSVNIAERPEPLTVPTLDYELSAHRMFDGRPIYAARGVRVHHYRGMVPVPIDAKDRKAALDFLVKAIDKKCAHMFPLDTEEKQHVDRKVGDVYYMRQRIVFELAGVRTKGLGSKGV
jgi:hypothetical protein